MELGLVGSGAMGAGLVGRLTGRCSVFVFDKDAEAVQNAVSFGATAVAGLQELADALAPPRAVWVLLPAGSSTEQTLDELSCLLKSDDVIVDGGNSHFRDSIRRAEALAEKGIHLLDVGTSGGQRGAELGYALMIGGEESVVDRLSPVFAALAAHPESGWGRVGPSGAGHFAKMVHNGIEYGLMRAYAQGLAVLESNDELGVDLQTVTDIWRHGAMARSAILDLTHEALVDNPGLGSLAPYVADVEPGRQTRQEAIDQVAQRGYDRDQFA